MASGRRTTLGTRSSQVAASDDFSSAVEKAKLRALYNFAYGLSHEINNPLANIATRAQTLLVDEADPDRRKKLATIVQQVFRASEMIADLMLFARPPALQLQKSNLAELADCALAELQPLATEQKTRLTRSGTQAVEATVDPVQIGVVLKALVQNSLEAVRTEGNIEVIIEPENQWQLRKSAFKANGQPREAARRLRSKSQPRRPQPTKLVCLSVVDDGPGIPTDMLANIFDPFFCGREAGRGLGLGLSKAWRIVDLHGGRIHVFSDPHTGTAITILLPQVPASLEAPQRRKR